MLLEAFSSPSSKVSLTTAVPPTQRGTDSPGIVTTTTNGHCAAINLHRKASLLLCNSDMLVTPYSKSPTPKCQPRATVCGFSPPPPSLPPKIVGENFAIEGRNLSYSTTTRQGKFVPILKDCSLNIPSGQFWMLLGPNGCGKSTLLKILAGLLKPTDGFVYVKKPRSFVFQNPDHQVVMPVVEADVAFGLGKSNLTQYEIKSRVATALDAVGMFEYLQRPVQTLSGGQKQRVAIAGALAEACKVLLLDELTTFLDENDQIGVINAVKNSLRNSKDVTALWVTHRLEELKYADGAVYMEDGRVIMDGDTSSIMGYISARQSSYIDQINS